MTGKERISRILKHQPVDRIGLSEHFWDDTYKTWIEQGHIKPDTEIDLLFGYDMRRAWVFNFVADLDFENQTIREDKDTITVLNGNGATLRYQKYRDGVPEHVDFMVKDREGWEKHIKPKLVADRRRIDFEAYREHKRIAEENDMYFMAAGLNVFEAMHPVCGHEYLLMGMALDPDWVKDMVYTYSRLIVELYEMLFQEEGYPDGLFIYEDLGYKGSPFMSPAMYEELVKPGHVYTIDYAKKHGMSVIMHSCGFIEPLLPSLIDAGIDGYNAIEVKAGMDLLKIHKLYGDKIIFMGGIDVRAICSNDKAEIDRELEAKIPIVKQGYNFILHSDHSIPNTVEYETYRYFIKKGLELGTY